MSKRRKKRASTVQCHIYWSLVLWRISTLEKVNQMLTKVKWTLYHKETDEHKTYVWLSGWTGVELSMWPSYKKIQYYKLKWNISFTETDILRMYTQFRDREQQREWRTQPISVTSAQTTGTASAWQVAFLLFTNRFYQQHPSTPGGEGSVKTYK